MLSHLLGGGSTVFLTAVLSVVAMTKKNANAALVYSFLYKIIQVSLSPDDSCV